MHFIMRLLYHKRKLWALCRRIVGSESNWSAVVSEGSLVESGKDNMGVENRRTDTGRESQTQIPDQTLRRGWRQGREFCSANHKQNWPCPVNA